MHAMKMLASAKDRSRRQWHGHCSRSPWLPLPLPPSEPSQLHHCHRRDTDSESLKELEFKSFSLAWLHIIEFRCEMVNGLVCPLARVASVPFASHQQIDIFTQFIFSATVAFSHLLRPPLGIRLDFFRSSLDGISPCRDAPILPGAMHGTALTDTVIYCNKLRSTITILHSNYVLFFVVGFSFSFRWRSLSVSVSRSGRQSPRRCRYLFVWPFIWMSAHK